MMRFATAAEGGNAALAPRAPAPAAPAPPAQSPFVALKPVHRVMLVGVYALYVFAAAVLALVNDVQGAELVIPALLVYAAVRVAPVLLYRPEYGWFHPLVFGALFGVLGLVRAFPIYAFGLEAHLALPARSPGDLSALIAWELVLTTLSVLAYYAGFFYLPTWRVPELNFSRVRHLRLKVVATVALSALAFYVYLQGQGGLYAHIVSWGQSRSVALAGEFYWLTLPTFAMYACLLWFASERDATRLPLFWACTAVSLIMTFLTAGSRSSIVYSMILGLLLWMIHTRRVPVLRTLALAVVAMLIMGVLGEVREATWEGKVSVKDLSGISRLETITSFVSGELADRSSSLRPILPVLARVPDEVGHLYGSSYLAVVTLPVPRKLWSGKPGLVGGQTGKVFFGYSNTAVPLGALGEAYWNFNTPGVILVFALFGAFHRWLTRVYRRYAGQSMAMLVLVITLFLLQPGSDGIVPWVFAVGPLLILALLYGILRSPRSRPSAGAGGALALNPAGGQGGRNRWN